MLKNKQKLIVLFTIFALVFTLSFSTVFAEPEDESSETATPESEAVVTTETPAATTTTVDESGETAQVADQEIYKGDLYEFNDNVTMDKLVDGNVYIFGNNVTISGQINGNLFVFAQKLTFSGSYVRNTIYAFANEVEFDGACNDLYIACNSLNVSYDSYIVRDVRAVTSSTLNFIGAVGRDAYLTANSISFGESEDSRALIYGNLEYKTPSEIDIPEGVVTGETKFEAITTNSDNTTVDMGQIIANKVMDLVKAIIYTLVVLALMIWLTPKFVEKTSEFVSTKAFLALGIGILSFVVMIIAGIILLISNIATPVGFAVLFAYGLIVSISQAIISVAVAQKFASDTKAKTFLFAALATVVIWALKLIPYVGGIVTLLVTAIGVGIVFNYMFTKNKKNKTEKSVEL